MTEAELLLTVDGAVHAVALCSADSLRIGSDPDCDLSFDGAGIAPYHATLRWEGGNRLRLSVLPGKPALSVNGRPISDEVIILPAKLELGGQELGLSVKLPAAVNPKLPALPPVPTKTLPTETAPALKGVSSSGILLTFGVLAVVLATVYAWKHFNHSAPIVADTPQPESPPPTLRESDPVKPEEETISESIHRPRPAPPQGKAEPEPLPPPPPVITPEELARPLIARLDAAGATLDRVLESNDSMVIALTVMKHTGVQPDQRRQTEGNADEAFATTLASALLAPDAQPDTAPADSLWTSLKKTRDEVVSTFKDAKKLDSTAARQLVVAHRAELAENLTYRFRNVLSSAGSRIRNDVGSARREALQIVEEAGAFQAKQAKAKEQMAVPLEQVRRMIEAADMLLANDAIAHYETLREVENQLAALTFDNHPEWDQIDMDLRPKLAAAEAGYLDEAVKDQKSAQRSIESVAATLHEHARYWTVVKAGLEDRFNGKITAAGRQRAAQALPDLSARWEVLGSRAAMIESPDVRTETLVGLMVQPADGIQSRQGNHGSTPWFGLWPDQRRLIGKVTTALKNPTITAHDQTVCDILATTKLAESNASLPSENLAALHLPVWLALEQSIAQVTDATERSGIVGYAQEHQLEQAMLNVIQAVRGQQRSEQQNAFGQDENARRIFYESEFHSPVPASVIQAAAQMHAHNLVLDTLANQIARIFRAFALPTLERDRLPEPHRIPALPGEAILEVRKLGEGLRRSSPLVPAPAGSTSAVPPSQPAAANAAAPQTTPPPATQAAAPAGDVIPAPPAGFWKLNEMFEGTPYQAYSSNGKRFLLHLAQATFKESSIYSGSADGIPGISTFAAFTEFQRRHNLPASGRFDAKTLEALDLLEMPDLNDWTPENDLRATAGRPSMARPPSMTPPPQPQPSPGEQLLRRAAETLIDRGLRELQR